MKYQALVKKRRRKATRRQRKIKTLGVKQAVVKSSTHPELTYEDYQLIAELITPAIGIPGINYRKPEKFPSVEEIQAAFISDRSGVELAKLLLEYDVNRAPLKSFIELHKGTDGLANLLRLTH